MCIYSKCDAETRTTESSYTETLILCKFKALSQGKASYVQETEHGPYE